MEPLVRELLKNHQKDKDLTGPKVQEGVKKLREKYGRIDEELSDNEQLVGLNWSGATLYSYNFNKLNLSRIDKPANFNSTFLRDASFKETILVEASFRNAFLSNAHLEKANLHGANFSRARLESAYLEKTDVINANFEEAFLFGAHLEGVYLMHCNFEKAILIEANLLGATLSDANFKNVDVYNTNLQLANLYRCRLNGSNIEDALLSDKDIHEIENKDGEKILKKLEHEIKNKELIDDIQNSINSVLISLPSEKNRYEKAADIYRMIKNILHQNGVYDKECEYHYKERRVYTKYLKKSKKYRGWLLNSVFRLLCGYGEKPLWVIPWVIFVIMCFGTLFWVFNGIQQDLSVALHPLDNYYFSVVTFTTLGFGDLYPNSVRGLLNIPWFRVIAALEAFIGAFLMALFVVVAAKRVMR